MALFVLCLLKKENLPAEASVVDGQGYTSTTTLSTNGFYNNAQKKLTDGSGIFGSIVVGSTTVGVITVYDATTSNALLRGSIATSSLNVLAYIGASPTTATYQYDSVFTNGLLVDAGANFAGGYTITWRK